jgi:5-methylcytosine-specific restriction endonuclease McrA
MSEQNEALCPLCGRILAEPVSRHHLIPLSKGGKDTPTILMHKVCQNKVHAVFNETELKNYYHTIERILENEEMIKFVKWVKKKELAFCDVSIKKK